VHNTTKFKIFNAQFHKTQKINYTHVKIKLVRYSTALERFNQQAHLCGKLIFIGSWLINATVMKAEVQKHTVAMNTDLYSYPRTAVCNNGNDYDGLLVCDTV